MLNHWEKIFLKVYKIHTTQNYRLNTNIHGNQNITVSYVYSEGTGTGFKLHKLLIIKSH